MFEVVNKNLVFIPILSMVCLVGFVWAFLFYLRIINLIMYGENDRSLFSWCFTFAERSLRFFIYGQDHPKGFQFKVFGEDISERLRLILNNLANLAEIPILFYVICWVAYSLNVVDTLFLFGCFVFVLFRYVHSFIHCTYNLLNHRFLAYQASCIALWLLVGKLIIELALNLSGNPPMINYVNDWLSAIF